MISLTPLETQVLAALNDESDANGHDFGVMELVEWKNRQQLGGVVSQLLAKGVLDCVDRPEVINGETVTQYYIATSYKS